MSLLCIKTGFYAQMPSGLFLYGDAFVVPVGRLSETVLRARYDGEYADMRETSTLLLAINSMSSEEPSLLNIYLNTWEKWFGERSGQDVSASNEVATIWQTNSPSILVADPGQWTWLGYRGVTAAKAKELI